MSRKHGHWGFTEEAKEWASRARRIQGDAEIDSQLEEWDAGDVGTTVAKLIESASDRIGSADIQERIDGWDAIGELCNGLPERVEQAWQAVHGRFEAEQDPGVVEAAVYALGHMAANDYKTLYMIPVAAEFVLDHKASASVDVRLAVAHSLPWFLTDDPDARLISVLIELSRDEDDEIRNWATFAIGRHLESDGPEIRDALRARAVDSHEETRSEAFVGLARRGDTSIVDALAHELESDSVWRWTVQAAGALGDPDLLAPLRKLEEWWDLDDQLLQNAISACDPDQVVEREARNDNVIASVVAQFKEAGLRLDEAAVTRNREEMEYDLDLRWVDESGETRTCAFGLDYVYLRSDVDGDPSLAARHIFSSATADALEPEDHNGSAPGG